MASKPPSGFGKPRKEDKPEEGAYFYESPQNGAIRSSSAPCLNCESSPSRSLEVDNENGETIETDFFCSQSCFSEAEGIE